MLLNSAEVVQELIPLLLDVERVVEYGPSSSRKVLVSKTLPMLSLCPKVRRYEAFDIVEQQAVVAANMVKDTKDIATTPIVGDFTKKQLTPRPNTQTAFFMFGNTIANLEGGEGTSPEQELKHLLTTLSKNASLGDLLLFSYDVETDEDKILSAYNREPNKTGMLTPLYRLFHSPALSGDFNPHDWQHEAIWHQNTRQLADYVYPTKGQSFSIGSAFFNIMTGDRFLVGNSYKLSPEMVHRVLASCGFKIRVDIEIGSFRLCAIEF